MRDAACRPSHVWHVALFLVLVGQGVSLGQVRLAPAAEAPGERILFIAFDAIPFQVAADLVASSPAEARRFRGFQGPSPLISTFPSTTTVAFSGLFESLGLAKPPGYEARFFDWQLRRVRGGGPRSYHQIAFSWREFFDWKTTGTLRKAIGFVRPVKFGRREVRQAVEAFLASDRELFFAYVTATDGVGHLKGPAAQARVLVELDRVLRDLDQSQPSSGERRFHTVVFSDHGIAGGRALKNVGGRVRRAVKAAGFRRKKRLQHDMDLTFVPYGLVSSFVAYTPRGKEQEAARVIASVSGVAFCAYQDQEGWGIEGDGGRARVRRKKQAGQWLWSYQPDGGDPLGYAPLLEELGRREGQGEGCFWTDPAWFEATRETLYPDGLYRIARAFDLVQNPASILCSVAPGHMFGHPLTDAASLLTGGRLKWTHGAMDRDASVGFIMSDHPDWHPAAAWRFDEALDVFAPRLATALGDPRRIYVAYFE